MDDVDIIKKKLERLCEGGREMEEELQQRCRKLLQSQEALQNIPQVRTMKGREKGKREKVKKERRGSSSLIPELYSTFSLNSLNSLQAPKSGEFRGEKKKMLQMLEEGEIPQFFSETDQNALKKLEELNLALQSITKHVPEGNWEEIKQMQGDQGIFSFQNRKNPRYPRQIVSERLLPCVFPPFL